MTQLQSHLYANNRYLKFRLDSKSYRNFIMGGLVIILVNNYTLVIKGNIVITNV